MDVKVCIKCTIATVTMHICTVIVVLAFIILVIFSLSLSLLLSLSPHSPFFLFNQHQTTVTWRTHLINIKPLPPINIKPQPYEAWSNHHWSLSPHSSFFSFDQHQTTTTDQHQTTATRSLIKSLPINSLISRFLISGFRIGWVMKWVSAWMGFWSWVGLTLNGLSIKVVMMMVVRSERERDVMKKIIKNGKRMKILLNKCVE